MHAYYDYSRGRRCSIAQALGQTARVKFKALVNEALREGIKRMMAPAKKRGEYRTRSVELGMCSAANVDNVAEILAVAKGESFK